MSPPWPLQDAGDRAVLLDEAQVAAQAEQALGRSVRVLGAAQRRLQSAALAADAKETLVCTYLSAVALAVIGGVLLLLLRRASEVVLILFPLALASLLTVAAGVLLSVDAPAAVGATFNLGATEEGGQAR